MALMLMDMTCDHDAMPRVYELVEQLAADPGVSVALRLQAAAVFHTSCGNLEVGVGAARSLVEEQRKNGNVGDLIRSLCNSAVSLRVAGLFEEAETNLLGALSIADHHGIRLGHEEVLPMLANMALERGHTDDAARWAELLKTRPLERGDKFPALELSGFMVRLALLRGRPSEARKFLPGSPSTLRRIPVAFRRAYQASLYVATDLAYGSIPNDRLLGILEEAHVRSRRALFQAYPAYVLYAGLRAAGKEDHAAKVLNDYLTIYRREPWPAPEYLLATLERPPRLTRKKRSR
jgi:hypothetical protein